ncbi:hypothetical protein EWM64_g6722 [Hericium alpestre]|uniref:Uncharacterized protein n=1 Tax=Hericium alpestre TaxID=135208 RepID=A0A4Y9ZTY7_9AGAM|nr:hypothetical protein EWM64_g6722 [Hericium alpestre]
MAQPNNAIFPHIPPIQPPPVFAGAPLHLPHIPNMVEHMNALSEAMVESSQSQNAMSASFHDLAQELGNVQNIPVVAGAEVQADILQAINLLINSVNQGNQRQEQLHNAQQAMTQQLNNMQVVMNQRFNNVHQVMNQRFDDVDERLDDVDQRLVNVEASIDDLAKLLEWEHNAATARTMNSLNPLGPYNAIPSKLPHAAYPGVFPPTSKALNNMTGVRCGELAAAWGIDIAGLSLAEKKKRIARFIGVNYTI